MAKYWTEKMIVMRLMWFKVMLVFLIPFGLTLQQQTEEWSGETWDNTHLFIKLRTLAVATLIGLNALQALFDKTSQKVEEELLRHREEKRRQDFIGPPSPHDLTNTQIIEKD